MRILITNDDGIHAEGLAILEYIAKTLSDDIWVVAPEKDQSGVSHSLTLSNPLRIQKIDERHFSVLGTPTDCVIMAIKHIMPDAPDIILSGVNAGANCAYDVTYSGTVGAAVEGTLSGIRSFALSQQYMSEQHNYKMVWDTVKHYAPEILKKILATPYKKGVLTNINFPSCLPSAVDGVEITKQACQAGHGLSIDQRYDSRHVPYFWFQFARDKAQYEIGSDAFAIAKNKISITPLHLDLTAYDEMKALENIFK